MFDFFKLSAPAKYSEQLLNAENLSFRQSISKEGIIITTEHGFHANRATFLDFDIIVWEHPTKPHRIEIKGSFHKLSEGGSNYKDFSFAEFQSAVKTLTDAIKIPPTELNVSLFEFGVNIKPPIETSYLIEGIKTLSGKKFERETYNGKGLLLRFDFSQYQVKVYDKGFQFAKNEPILRFEVKVKKMAYINPKGSKITTLANFIDGNRNPYFGKLLLNQLNKLIVCPEGMINPDLIFNPRTRRNFLNGLNPDYWTGLPEKAYRRQFKAFKTIFQQMAAIDIYSEIHALICQKWEDLSGQKVEFAPYVYGNNLPFDNSTNKDQRYFCKGCGKDITHQTTTHKFCAPSIVGVKQAHDCRNKVYNPIHSEKAKKERLKDRQEILYPGPTLFPLFIHYGIL